MKIIHEKILKFIKKSTETNFQALTQKIENEKIIEDKYVFKTFLHLILKVSNNHYRSQGFYTNIERILSLYQKQIRNYFTNDEIFNIFKNNKRILLFLFEEKTIIFDQNILGKISREKYKKSNYSQYFMPEINSFTKISEEIPENFQEKRKIGENDSYICELIRNDSIEDFITFVNRNNISLNNAIIRTSIYETNPFLIKNKNQSLIEYAAFFGSYQIFQYLVMNRIELTPNLWNYVIHGKNANLIHLLEENHIKFDNKNIIIESIKCHHNQIANYFMINEKININNFSSIVLKYYNFEYMTEKFINKTVFFDLCKNDYILFVPKFLHCVKINEEIDYIKEYREETELNNKIKIVNQRKTVLHVAVEKENVEIIKLLLTRNDIDLNLFWKEKSTGPFNKMSTLHLAVENSNTEIVKLLLSCQNIDVNMLTYICSYQNIDDFTESIIVHEKTALHMAVENGNADIARILLSHPNIDVNQYMITTNIFGHGMRNKKTALYMAVEKDDIEMVYLLCLHPYTNINLSYTVSIRSGIQCEPEIRIRLEKKTPFQLAAENNNQTICQIITMNK